MSSETLCPQRMTNKLLPILLVVIFSSTESFGDSKTEFKSTLAGKTLYCEADNKALYTSILIEFTDKWDRNLPQARVCSRLYEDNMCERNVRYLEYIDNIQIFGACHSEKMTQKDILGKLDTWYQVHPRQDCMKLCPSSKPNCYDSMGINRMDLTAKYTRHFSTSLGIGTRNKSIPAVGAFVKKPVSGGFSIEDMTCSVTTKEEKKIIKQTIKKAIRESISKRKKMEEIRILEEQKRHEMRKKERMEKRETIINNRKI